MLARASSLNWSDGTRPDDLVPYRELNLGLLGYAPLDGQRAVGLQLQYGFELFKLQGMADFECFPGLAAAPATRGEVRMDFRTLRRWSWAPHSMYFGLSNEGDQDTQSFAGLVFGRERANQDFSLNLGLVWDESQGGTVVGTDIRYGYRAPYLAWTLRPGVEFYRDGLTGQTWLIPQLAINLPGDLSLQCGVKVPLEARNITNTVLLGINYEIFPDP